MQKFAACVSPNSIISICCGFVVQLVVQLVVHTDLQQIEVAQCSRDDEEVMSEDKSFH